jgi:hypothetical protein
VVIDMGEAMVEKAAAQQLNISEGNDGWDDKLARL